MHEHIYLALAAGTTSILQRIPLQWAALLVIVAAFLSGMGVYAAVGDTRTYGPLIRTNTEQLTTIAEQLALIEELGVQRLAATSSLIELRLRNIELILWCQHAGLVPCPVEPTNPLGPRN